MIGQIYNKSEPLAHTYSIVAFDSLTGEIGVAVQSHWFSVGTIVSWAEAGVGAVATQSFTNPNFGPDGLKMLKEGKSPKEILDIMIKADSGRDERQVAIIDWKGNVAAYTGRKCIPSAGQIEGKHYSVQANMMLNDQVWPAMSRAFEASKGSLEERMLAALEAAEAAGGDIRGRQSAALLVVRPNATGKLWEDRKTDLRIDDHAEPLKEIRRLLVVKMAYDYMNQGDVALAEGDMEHALSLFNKASELCPENDEMKFWTAVCYANGKQVDASLPLFKAVFKKNENWRTLVERIYNTDLLPIKAEDFKKIVTL